MGNRDYRRYKKQEKYIEKNAKKCPYCGHSMRYRGCGNVVGGYSWKCRNKKCGRVIWKRKIISPESIIIEPD